MNKRDWRRFPAAGWRQLGGVSLFLVLAPAVLAACILGGVIPQGEDAAPWARLLGLDAIFSRRWFLALLGLLGLNLAACSLQRLRTLRLPVWLTHVGMLVILLGGLLTGLASRHATLVLEPGKTVAEAPARDGTSLALPFSVRLVRFTVEKYGTDRHLLAAAPGEELPLETGRAADLGRGVTARLLTAYPDFMMGDHGPTTRSADPRNPAALVEIRRGGKASRLWLFERFPLFYREHGTDKGLPDLLYRFTPARVKQFVSELEVLENGKVVAAPRVAVNSPLHRRGWRLYQSGYDPARPGVSILQVSRDPGTPVVYLGFVLLPLGLLLTAFDRRGK